MTQMEELTRLQTLLKKGGITQDEYLKMVAKTTAPGRIDRAIQYVSTMSPEEKKQKILFIMALTGILCILAGLGLIIAANWAFIPAPVKVGGALAALALSLGGVGYCHIHERPILKELALFIAFFLICGNIAVIQQSYHLELTWAEGSAIWWALSLPLLFFTKRKYLYVCSAGLFVFGAWEYLVDLWKFLNYQMVAGCLSIIVFLSFLGGQKMRFCRALALYSAIFVLFMGDFAAESMTGIIMDTVFFICALAMPKTEVGEVRFCNQMLVFIALRVFLLFCHAYHNLMTLGVQMVVFGVLLSGAAWLYYYFFEKLQNSLKRLVHHD